MFWFISVAQVYHFGLQIDMQVDRRSESRIPASRPFQLPPSFQFAVLGTFVCPLQRVGSNGQGGQRAFCSLLSGTTADARGCSDEKEISWEVWRGKMRNVEYFILLVMSELSTVRCDRALGLWLQVHGRWVSTVSYTLLCFSCFFSMFASALLLVCTRVVLC